MQPYINVHQLLFSITGWPRFAWNIAACVHHYIIIRSIGLCHTEVRALYGHLNCGWLRVATLATVGSERGWLGAVVARHASGHNVRCASNGSLLNGRACQLRAFVHYSSSHTVAQSVIVACMLLLLCPLYSWHNAVRSLMCVVCDVHVFYY